VRTTRTHAICLIVIFLSLIGLCAPTQILLELREGEVPQIVELFRRAPTKANRNRFEHNLESRCCLAQAVRPWMQFVRFVLLEDMGEKAVLGRDGWIFYRPAVQYLVEPWQPQNGEDDIFDAIVSFRDELDQRGIRLLVMVAPNKASIYPDKLAARADETACPMNATTCDVLTKLRQADVEVIDLFECYAQARLRTDVPACYLVQDSHWSPEGMRRAAAVAARKVLESDSLSKGTVAYQQEPVTVQRYGDVLRMMRVPQIERLFEPELMDCTQIIDSETGEPYADDPSSPVLVLGDSFLRIYERDEPHSGGFVAHLAYHLGFGVTSIVNDGGASTLVRQQLARRPKLLEGKKVVVWEFVERDIRFGTEGWQVIPLPKDKG